MNVLHEHMTRQEKLEHYFSLIEAVACPVNELLPEPYDDPYNTARLRPSMHTVPLTVIGMQLLAVRYERFNYFPNFK